MSQASRGEIWLVGLDPAKGRKQAGMRPALIISVDIFKRPGCIGRIDTDHVKSQGYPAAR